MTYKILITDDLSPQGLVRLESEPDIEFDIVKGLTAQGLAERIPGYDGLIVRSSVKVTAQVIEAADKLKVVGRAGMGVDNIDVDAASLKGIIVTNTPGANSVATAEHAMALLLAMCRHVPQAYAKLKQGKWDRKSFTGIQLYRKTIGIIGMGRIGARVAIRCQSFGMEVLAYDPYLTDEAAAELKVDLVSLDELFARSDFITLHATSTAETEKLIDAQAIAKMKDGARLINTARGALIDVDALVEGLKSGKVAGAALDVFIAEPLPADSPLLQFDNVVVTPHLAASTEEAQRDVGTQIVDQLIDILRETDFRNVVNMPLVDANVLTTLRPYLNLAEKIGSLQTQMADGPIERVEVEVHGDELNGNIKPVTLAILKGLLEPIVVHVNYINAPAQAKRRGITVLQANGAGSATTPDYPNLISCRVEWPDGGCRIIAGTLFNHNEPRLVQVDNYRLDVRPEGIIVIVRNQDRPGFIGRVGTLLGQNNINIASWRYGRTAPYDHALCFIAVDEDVPDSVIEAIRDIDLIEYVKKVRL